MFALFIDIYTVLTEPRDEHQGHESAFVTLQQLQMPYRCWELNLHHFLDLVFVLFLAGGAFSCVPFNRYEQICYTLPD